LDFLPKESAILLSKQENIVATIDKLYEKAESIYQKDHADSSTIKRTEPEGLYITSANLLEQLEKHHQIHIEPSGEGQYTHRIAHKTSPQPSFNKQFDMLIDNLNENKKEGYSNYIFCSNETQAHRLQDIFSDSKRQISKYQSLFFPIHEGFVDPNTKVVCYSDHQ